MFPGPVPLESISAHPVAKDGISLSTAIHGIVHMWQGNTQDLHRVRHIEGIVTTFTKERCASDSGLTIVNMESLVMPSLACSRLRDSRVR